MRIGERRNEGKKERPLSFSTSPPKTYLPRSKSSLQKNKTATSAQPLAALFGPPRPEPRAGRLGPEPAATTIAVVSAETCRTPWELISEHPLLSGVARAIRGGNDTALWALLNDPDAPITVLAPDNEALTSAAEALGIPLSAVLNGSEPMVSAILRAHVLNTTKPLSALGPEATVTSLAGTPVRVFSPTLVAERKTKGSKDGKAPAPARDGGGDGALAPAPAPRAPAAAARNEAAADPAEPVPRRRSSRRALSEAATYVNKEATATTNLNQPDPTVGGSAIISTVVDLANNALGGNSSGAAASSSNATGSGVSPVDALLNSFISLFAGVMGGGGGKGGDGGGMLGMMGNASSSSLFMGKPSKDLGPGWKVTKRRGCAGGCSRVSDWTFAPVGKTAASSLPDNATFAVLRNATVEAGNVRTCAGYLHVVDGVLVPELLSKKEKGAKGAPSRLAVLELGDGDGAAVSRISVPLNRSVDADTERPIANVTVEYLGKVAKSVAARDKEAASAAKKAAAAAASPAPAPAPASRKDGGEDDLVASAPAPEVTQASVVASNKKTPEAAKVVGETISPLPASSPKGAAAKQPSA